MLITMEKQAGKRIKELRAALNLSQEKFAIESGISSSTVTKVELGTIPLTMDVIEKINSRWGAPVEWLQYGKGKLTFQKVVKKPVENIYQDALYAELRDQSARWQQKYDDLFQLFNKLIDRGNLGKQPALKYAGKLRVA